MDLALKEPVSLLFISYGDKAGTGYTPDQSHRHLVKSLKVKEKNVMKVKTPANSRKI
ncbi:MAG: hypothetical protein OEZ36_13165 [Spirochaetota bacterium]|nr:hypothetical protein [Spirochaetota bacterium]